MMLNFNKIFFLIIVLTIFAIGAASANASMGGNPNNNDPIRIETYNCGEDVCDGYRCVTGNEVSPACYNSEELAKSSCRKGDYLNVQSELSNLCKESTFNYVWYRR